MALWTDGNALKLLENGDAFFNEVLKNIQTAQHHIFFETYIYEWDKIGQQLGNAFIQAAKRGVKVHVLLDGFGSHHLPTEVIENWRYFGIRAHFYQPAKKRGIFKNRSFPRLHRKCIAIDSHVAFVGGINVVDDYLQQPNDPPRLDYAIQVKGPLVTRIHKHMALFFFRQFKDWKSYFSVLKTSLSTMTTFLVAPVDPVKGASSAAFVIRGTMAHRRSIEKEYLKAITKAQTEILIANAYFLPGLWFRFKLKRARKRGVRVRLFLQGRPEFRFVKWATQAMYREFLKHGIEIYEYKTSYLHAKVAVIDGEWSTVGSCNLDPLSMLFNFEANVIILDSQFAKQLHERLENHIQQESIKIELENYQQRNFLERFTQGFCLFFIRWIVSLKPFNDSSIFRRSLQR